MGQRPTPASKPSLKGHQAAASLSSSYSPAVDMKPPHGSQLAHSAWPYGARCARIAWARGRLRWRPAGVPSPGYNRLQPCLTLRHHAGRRCAYLGGMRSRRPSEARATRGFPPTAAPPPPRQPLPAHAAAATTAAAAGRVPGPGRAWLSGPRCDMPPACQSPRPASRRLPLAPGAGTVPSGPRQAHKALR